MNGVGAKFLRALRGSRRSLLPSRSAERSGRIAGSAKHVASAPFAAAPHFAPTSYQHSTTADFIYSFCFLFVMVVESIVNYVNAEKRPDEMLLFGFIVATLAIFLAMWVFPSYASFAMVTFTVMAVLPLMVHIIQYEKEKQEKVRGLARFGVHRKAVVFFMFLFVGFLLAYTFWFLLLPTDVANNLFFLQINTITEINTPSGSAINTQGAFGNILSNNIRILALSILFSFIFGSGALFILTWNASVLGVAIATAVKIAVAASGGSSAAYFGAFSFALLRFLIHGIPEITAYFLGGLAGGVVSFALLDYKFGIKKLRTNLLSSFKDASVLTIAAIVILILATVIEVFVTPVLTR